LSSLVAEIIILLLRLWLVWLYCSTNLKDIHIKGKVCLCKSMVLLLFLSVQFCKFHFCQLNNM